MAQKPSSGPLSIHCQSWTFSVPYRLIPVLRGTFCLCIEILCHCGTEDEHLDLRPLPDQRYQVLTEYHFCRESQKKLFFGHKDQVSHLGILCELQLRRNT